MESLATGQRSLGDASVRYPLWPPLTRGCPRTATAEMVYPVEVDYAYDAVPADLFDPPALPAGYGACRRPYDDAGAGGGDPRR